MEITLEEAFKKRAAAQGWLTRAEKEVDRLLKVEGVEGEELNDAIIELEEKLNAYDESQVNCELFYVMEEEGVLEEKWESDMDSVCRRRREAKKRVRDGKKKLLEVWPSTRRESDDTGSTIISTMQVNGKSVKLPKIELPKFSGTKRTWVGFWEAFEASVNSREDLPDVLKFTYLRAQLRDMAAQAVEGLPLEAGSYPVAIDILKQRFGRKELLIFEHIQALLELKNSSEEQLQSFLDSVQIHVRSLEKLGVSGDQYGVFLTPLILSKLPEKVCLEWARNEKKEGDLKFLLEFLKQEIERLDRCRIFANSNTDRGCRREENTRSFQRVASCSSLLADNGSAGRVSCMFCQKQGHKIASCFAFLKLDVSRRVDEAKKRNLCYKCFEPGHIAWQCTKVVIGKKKNPGKGKAKEQEDESVQGKKSDSHATSLSSTALSSRTASTTILPMAKADVVEGDRRCKCTLLFDSGSDKTYIDAKLVKRLQLRKIAAAEISYSAFGGSKSESKVRGVYVVNFISREGEKRIQAVEIDKICQPLRRKIPLGAFEVGLEFAELPSDDLVEIDILVGQDQFWSLMQTETVKLGENLVAQKSVFGYVVSGAMSVNKDSHAGFFNPQTLLNISDIPSSIVQTFWSLDTIGIVPVESVDPVLRDFEKKITFDEKDGRYVVKLPWKGDAEKASLLTNFHRAKAMVERLDKKMDEKTKNGYEQYFEELEKENMVVECGTKVNNPVVYLTHRPVVRESSATTKIRPVFNASLSGANGVSLNDCLHTGPNLLPDLTKILIRFRRWPVALSADITKAFLQIKISEEDQDACRFLLLKNNQLRHMKFQRVTFGLASSPFLLNATLQHHLRTMPDSDTVKELKANLYVDDWLSGANDEDQAKEMYQCAQEVIGKAGMQLAKWSSNKNIFEKESLDLKFSKILGTEWKMNEDMFAFHGVEVPFEVVPTKRLVLSCLARMFDPLGLISPYVMTLKILLQDIWRLGIPWDEPLPLELAERFIDCIRGSEYLKKLKIRRQYGGGKWDDNSITLVVYCDASEKGYGCCVYLKGSNFQALCFSKARVAPMKRLTLARLELLGCLLGARSVQFVREALLLEKDVPIECYTDSKIAEYWIKAAPTRWKQFVRNRVEEIQTLTDSSLWNHVKGTANPADLLTRGLPAKDLVSGNSARMWFLGSCGQSPDNPPPPTTDGGEEEIMSNIALTVQEEVAERESKLQTRVFPIERYSSLNKALRVTALVVRFIQNLKSDTTISRNFAKLSLEELHKAQVLLIREEQRLAFYTDIKHLEKKQSVSKKSVLYQLHPHLENGLIRKGSRLDRGQLSYNTSHPYILPKGQLAKLYVRFIHQNLCHPGVDTMITLVRHSFWIIGLRTLAKAVKKACIACQRHDARKFQEEAASLPEDRVTMSAPFTVIGVDYAGPLFCTDSDNNLSVLLATCAVTRAVHLELVNDQSLPNFLLALRRLAARRGLPRIIYSDNAKTFQSADNFLSDYFGVRAPTWKFIPPLSPWWGGWWERLVGSMKNGLKKSLGKKCLSKLELETCLYEVESCVNSRPLTYVGDDPSYSKALTPNDFIIGRQTGFDSPVEDGPFTSDKVPARECLRLQRLENCWKMWSTDYLKNLPSCVKFTRSNETLKIGSLVLIREDAPLPRMQWPLGVIEKLHFGQDGKCRVVDVRTSKGMRTRDVRRLHVLEMNCGEQDSNDDVVKDIGENDVDAEKLDIKTGHIAAEAGINIRSRRCRPVKPRLVLDL